MKIPKYIEDTLWPSSTYRARYEFDYDIVFGYDWGYAAGYTIRIYKYSAFEHIETFNKRLDKLKAWVERQPGGECIILRRPDATHYQAQYAVVTIYDPVMKCIEHLIRH